MPNVVCWSCEALTQHELLLASAASRENDPRVQEGDVLLYGVYQCGSCYCYAIGINFTQRRRFNADPMDILTSIGVRYWQPRAGMTKSYTDVPPHIANAATEAFECHGRQHFRASILLARSVIEATAKEKGIDSGPLAVKIKALAEQGFVRPHIREAADEIRDLGNEMAHGDFALPVTEEDSKLVVDLMEEILAEVFQSPAKVSRAQAAAALRKAQGETTA